MEAASALVNKRHGLAKLDNIWGKAGSRRSIKRLMDTISSALQEYVISSDLNECERQLRELDVPHFHHGMGGSMTDNIHIYIHMYTSSCFFVLERH